MYRSKRKKNVPQPNNERTEASVICPYQAYFRNKPRAGLLFFIETTKKQIKRRNTHD